MTYVSLDNINCYHELIEKKDDKGKYYIEKPERAIHYCSISSFLAFVDDYIQRKTISRKIDGNQENLYYLRFFASHIRFLNDRNEYVAALKKLKETLIDDRNELNEEIYVACFSEAEDDLTQWKYYGKDCGLAVEFDLDNVKLNYCNLEKAKYDMMFDPRKVEYDKPETVTNCLKASKGEVLKRTASNVAQAMIPYWKDHNFIAEAESRIALYNVYDVENGEQKKVSSTKYRLSGELIKPYIEMIMFLNSEEGKKRLPIKSVCIGPGHNQKYILNAVYRILEPEENEINSTDTDDMTEIETTNGIIIKRSLVPFLS